jgi:flavin-dependent dehydrogenase
MLRRRTRTTSARTDVVIIGAGVAGLAAARRLHEQGAEFLRSTPSPIVSSRVRSARSRTPLRWTGGSSTAT